MQDMQYEKTINQLDKLIQINNVRLSRCRTFHELNNLPLYDTKFLDVEKFHHPGLSPVLDKTGGYHIDLEGRAAYKKRFDKVFGFYCNRAAVIDKEKYYHIDSKGNRLYKNSYDWVGNYQENKCVVRKGDRFFHIELEGNKIYLEEYDYVGDFKDDIAVVYQNQKSSHLNDKGHLIHNKWYKKLGIFHKGYANAEDDKGWFHINLDGKSVYKTRYKMVEPFYNGLAKVETFSGILGQIDSTGNMKYVIYQPDKLSQMHQISAELVGFWNTYLLNATAQIGILQLLPTDIETLAKSLNANQAYLLRFMRALWEINLVSYDKEKNIWKLMEKGQFIIDNPFMLKATKMWGSVILEKNWQKLPELLKQQEATSFPSFKENERNDDIKTELYQALLGYTKFDITKFSERVAIDQSNKILLFGVHSLSLIDILKAKGINSISYYNYPKLPEQLTKDFDIDFKEKGQSIMEYNTVIFGRFLQHQDDKKTLSYLQNLKNSKISRILLIETIIDEYSPIGGAVDINIMVETGGKLRSKNNWQDLLRQVEDFSISIILPLTNYLSVIDIRKK